ncbi:ABC transporter permease [Variovorax sp. Sphag1AA]|uniref:ABC transporter permease n=1 Tax=Variovorax sp. Sphag1AA TaxID=2587027 RepID=UPI00161EA73F|nr:ABC transporter permease [Variovorax sp. Sphag1AA]MBB3181475.1 peptide/nickel transport system permease protein [Variovorax sp. Sphag1AA]
MPILRRVLATLPILFGAAVFTFLLTRVLPGDAAAFLASGQASAEDIAALRQQLGLDLPLHLQLLDYLSRLAHGDWGQSFTTGQPVVADLLQRLPASMELSLFAFALALAIGLPLGIAAALKPGGAMDHVCRAVCTAGSCAPTFVVGLLLIYVLYFSLGWAAEPVGRLDPMLAPPPVHTGFLLIDAALAGDGAAWRSALSHLLLPAVSMALFSVAPLARITRSSMLAVLGSDFMRTARALGLPHRQALLTYALRNALLPVLTTMGLVFSYMLGANVVIEKLFAWPGIGSYALDALMSADHAPVQGFVLLVAVVFSLVNLLVDLLGQLADPRTRGSA